MKKYLLLLFVIGTLFMSCGKDAEKPSVYTLDVTQITDTTAVCGGEIISNGGAEITAKGVCWSTAQNPTTEDNYVNAIVSRVDEPATDIYECTINDLQPNTTYYIRAFAMNEIGTSYGEEKSFNTLEESNPDDGNDDGDDDGNDDGNDDGDDDGNGDEVEVLLPEVATASVTEITETTAVCGGNVVSDGGAEVTARGVCWSVNPNPTIDNKHTEDGIGVGEFVSYLPNIAMNTTYYIRAYATNENGTSYGEELTFTTLEGDFINGYEFVDLSLPSGLKWATCNIGAESPEEYGSYYAWGMTTTPADNNYFQEYCSTYGVEMKDISGDPQYDVATLLWGGTWRMPTKDEFSELRIYCTCEWTTHNGVAGYKITGTNANYIFLPAAGYREYSIPFFEGMSGSYWTSTPRENLTSSYYFGFDPENYWDGNSTPRFDGLTVRPVSD